MKTTSIIRGLILAMVVLPVSCTTPARIGYLRDLEYNTEYAARPAPELKLKVDDQIAIQVYSVDPELSAPFNTGAGLTTGSGIEASMSSSYTVDGEGNIDFPVLGDIHVEGKTLAEVRKIIADEIARRGYIREPVVKASLENFTITILGQTGQSVMPVKGNSINILQVIAEAGGIAAETAKINDIMVVRTENGERKAYTLDLQTKDLYESPVFYLQQNDLVYVKPRGLRMSNAGDLFLKIFSPAVSAVSALAYMLLWSSR